jgi:hypothetical protein
MITKNTKELINILNQYNGRCSVSTRHSGEDRGRNNEGSPSFLELRASGDYNGPKGVYVSLFPTIAVMAIGGEKEFNIAQQAAEYLGLDSIVYHEAAHSGMR